MLAFFITNFSLKKLLLYMLRWQLSSPILGLFVFLLGKDQNPIDSIGSVIVGNIVGSLIFFWVDIYIFSKGNLPTQWEVLEDQSCYDCGLVGRVYRLALAPKYNKVNSSPEFRCEKCSINKSKELRKLGKFH